MSKANNIYYSDKYCDECFEYRHVMLPKDVCRMVPKGRLMSEAEWRGLGVQQSRGWIHYMVHDPEPHILLFRRELTEEMKKQQRQEGCEQTATC
ncbi:Cyclin-dependent kinases regulatory subunit 1 [Oopsacas minuta]|uniref:Cyclin-dependent kinases regulatory subunit n=1 Tax=Oopsacas minuta TaxID=111878 RepID=A0AAV7KBH1_9METZ|nr:Cyclin-dependent kinases regulatory subunit 1 [Oopsacas minuta]